VAPEEMPALPTLPESPPEDAPVLAAMQLSGPESKEKEPRRRGHTLGYSSRLSGNYCLRLRAMGLYTRGRSCPRHCVRQRFGASNPASLAESAALPSLGTGRISAGAPESCDALPRVAVSNGSFQSVLDQGRREDSCLSIKRMVNRLCRTRSPRRRKNPSSRKPDCDSRLATWAWISGSMGRSGGR